MDIFDEKGIKPMLIAEMQEAFDSEDYIFEFTKKDLIKRKSNSLQKSIQI